MGWVQNLKEVKILNLNLAFQTDMKATCQGKKTVFLFFFSFPTQGSNLGLLHRRQNLYCVSHQRSPDFLFIFACDVS